MFTDKSTFLRVTVLTGAGVGLLLCTFAAADPPEPGYRDPAVFTTGGTSPYGLALGYVNNDALLDLVVANEGGNSVTVFLNSGVWTGNPPDQGFQDENEPDPPEDLTIKYTVPGDLTEPFVALGDFNSDNKLDIVVNEQSDDGEYFVFYNDGTGGFAAATTYSLNWGSVQYTPYGVGVGDFDNDGNPDIALATERIVVSHGDAALVVAWGDGDSHFIDQPYVDFLGEGGVPFELVVADLNGTPGLLDVVMSDAGVAQIHVCINGGSRNFTLSASLAIQSKALTACKPKPYTAPGADVALTDLGARNVFFYRNDGEGGFLEAWSYELPQARLLQLLLVEWRFQRLRDVYRALGGECGRNVVPISTECWQFYA